MGILTNLLAGTPPGGGGNGTPEALAASIHRSAVDGPACGIGILPQLPPTQDTIRVLREAVAFLLAQVGRPALRGDLGAASGVPR